MLLRLDDCLRLQAIDRDQHQERLGVADARNKCAKEGRQVTGRCVHGAKVSTICLLQAQLRLQADREWQMVRCYRRHQQDVCAKAPEIKDGAWHQDKSRTMVLANAKVSKVIA